MSRQPTSAAEPNIPKLRAVCRHSKVYWRRYLTSLSCLVLSLLATLWAADRYNPLPIKQLDDLAFSQQVLDRDDKPLRFTTTAKGYWRFKTTENQISPVFIDMLLRFEDKRFYQHSGVDFLALIRATQQWLTHGRIVSGGSTITMQVARLLQPRPRTLLSKAQQMLRAWQLEWHLSKAEILNLYLNLAPYGGNIQGISAASWFYFGVSEQDLYTSQAALLVSLPQNPERLRPDRHPARAQQRRDDILLRLAEQNILSDKLYQLALTSPVPKARLSTPKTAMHLATRVLAENMDETKEVKEANKAPTLHSKNLTIKTTIDSSVQNKLQQLASNIQARLPRQATVAMLVADRETMQVAGYVGSADFFAKNYPGSVDMIPAIRSPGSALKPLIYGLAFNDGWLHPQTIINDNASDFEGYQPRNFDDRYAGEMTVRKALQHSRNIPAIKVLDRLGPDNFANRLALTGQGLSLPADSTSASLPIAVGGVGSSLAQLVGFYGAIANHGIWQPLQYIYPNDNQNSKNIENSSPTSSPLTPHPPVRLFSAKSAWQLAGILKDMPKPLSNHQRQKSAQLAQTTIAFKTGTSYGYRDAWSIGFSSRWVVGIWVGRPDGAYQSKALGLQQATPIMLDVFDSIGNQRLENVEDSEIVKHTPVGDLLNNLSNNLLAEIPQDPFLAPADASAKRYLTNSVPKSLQYFDLEPQERQHKPTILYPPDQSQLELASISAPLPKQSIQLRVQAEKFPLVLMINGEITSTIKHSRDRALFTPARTGAYELVLLDPLGKSSRSHIWVNKAQ